MVVSLDAFRQRAHKGVKDTVKIIWTADFTEAPGSGGQENRRVVCQV